MSLVNGDWLLVTELRGSSLSKASRGGYSRQSREPDCSTRVQELKGRTPSSHRERELKSKNALEQSFGELAILRGKGCKQPRELEC